MGVEISPRTAQKVVTRADILFPHFNHSTWVTDPAAVTHTTVRGTAITKAATKGVAKVEIDLVHTTVLEVRPHLIDHNQATGASRADANVSPARASGILLTNALHGKETKH